MQNLLKQRICAARQGFTFLEVVTAMVILGIAMVFFYAVFMTSWKAYEEYIARADLWQESNVIMEMLSINARETRQIDVSQSDIQKTADLVDVDGQTVMSFMMTNEGIFKTVNITGVESVLSENLDFSNSSFVKDGKALIVNLAFQQDTLIHTVRVQTSSEFFPRN